jgi:hypothetical protein
LIETRAVSIDGARSILYNWGVAHRSFTDRDGVSWEVRDVLPSWADRRHGADRRELPRARRLERRALLGKRIGVRAELSEGWLCFRGAGEKHRVAPIPEGWESFDDTRLTELMRSVPAQPDHSRKV